MEKIKDKDGKLLCLIHRKDDWEEGLDFLSEDNDSVQVGTWYYNENKKLQMHSHNYVDRSVNITQECVYMVSGSMLADIRDRDLNPVKQVILNTGDLAIMLDGAHGYEILENGTKVLETKNGPFLGVEIDKIKY